MPYPKNTKETRFAEVAAQWGSDHAGDKGRFAGDGALFYNFGSEIQKKDNEYLGAFLAAIDRTIASAKASGVHEPEEITELEELRAHVGSLLNVSSFVRAYITTALWSSTGPAHGQCPCCCNEALLTHYWEEAHGSDAVCAKCGTEEIANYDPLEDNYSIDDFDPKALAQCIADCKDFEDAQRDVIEAAIATGEVKCGPDFDEWDRAAHDFWLTRNGHGAGFWDGDWPKPYADTLTAAAKVYGNVDIMPGDDGKLYI